MLLSTLIPDLPEIRIVDVGALDLGEKEGYQRLVEAGLAVVMGFEPDEKACQHLNDSNPSGRNRYLPYFIGDGQPATYHETNWVATGSLFPPNSPLLKKFQRLAELAIPVAQHQVETTRLDDIAEIERIDFLKMDIQGAELMALKSAEQKLKDTLVINVEVEFVELYKGQPLFADIDQYLRSQGFQFHCFNGEPSGRAFKPLMPTEGIQRTIRQHLWADVVYVRDWMTLDLLTQQQLYIYAMLVHELYTSVDLAHLVLKHADDVYGGDLASRYLKTIVGG
jgi:FkbM family methyltransferase